eukprot:2875903-Pyramimonas_sp.AAC.1
MVETKGAGKGDLPAVSGSLTLDALGALKLIPGPPDKVALHFPARRTRQNFLESGWPMLTCSV